MFVTEVGSFLTTVLWIQALAGKVKLLQDLSVPLLYGLVYSVVCEFFRGAG